MEDVVISIRWLGPLVLMGTDDVISGVPIRFWDGVWVVMWSLGVAETWNEISAVSWNFTNSCVFIHIQSFISLNVCVSKPDLLSLISNSASSIYSCCPSPNKVVSIPPAYLMLAEKKKRWEREPGWRGQKKDLIKNWCNRMEATLTNNRGRVWNNWKREIGGKEITVREGGEEAM